MQEPKVVPEEEWLKARREHLAKEKEFTRMRDQLSKKAMRRVTPYAQPLMKFCHTPKVSHSDFRN